ncbi:hypothetical protein M3J09_009222 [Ascochyta lentis]
MLMNRSDQGVISLIFVMPELHNHFPETAPGHARYGFNVGFMTGMLELGAFIGCLFFPYLADRISRKWGLTVATVFFCVGAIFQTAAWNYDSLVTGRFIGGIGVGTLATAWCCFDLRVRPLLRRLVRASSVDPAGRNLPQLETRKRGGTCDCHHLAGQLHHWCCGAGDGDQAGLGHVSILWVLLFRSCGLFVLLGARDVEEES